MLKQPGRPEFAGRFLAGHPNDRRCPNDEQAPQLAVVLLADAAELLLAAAAVRLRSHTQPCRELSTLSKDGRIRHGATIALAVIGPIRAPGQVGG
jgi:hypothetical protein